MREKPIQQISCDCIMYQHRKKWKQAYGTANGNKFNSMQELQSGGSEWRSEGSYKVYDTAHMNMFPQYKKVI